MLKLYPEYLRGNGKADNNECSKHFEAYQKCLKVSATTEPSPTLLDWHLYLMSHEDRSGGARYR